MKASCLLFQAPQFVGPMTKSALHLTLCSLGLTSALCWKRECTIRKHTLVLVISLQRGTQALVSSTRNGSLSIPLQ